MVNDFSQLDAQTAEGHLAQVTNEELPGYADWLDMAQGQIPEPEPMPS